jgi:hypothetical protein
MTKKLSRNLIFSAISIFILLSLPSCFIIGGQTIYEDPEHVDFNGEDGDDPESEAHDEDVDAPEAGGPVAASVEDIYFEHDGVRLYYNPQLILDIQPSTETISASSGGGPNEVAHPEFVHFDLYMEQAHVYITPLAEYEAAADFAPGTIADLRALIDDPGSLSGCVPELPLGTFYRMCGHQQFNSNLKRVNFANGSGVRFITIHGIHDFSPVDNENLVYVFQGFTDDGKYYVKMFVRLLHAQLPVVGEIPAEIYGAADQEQVDKYFDDFREMLNESEADFSPKLDWIDAFLASLRVE